MQFCMDLGITRAPTRNQNKREPKIKKKLLRKQTTTTKTGRAQQNRLRRAVSNCALLSGTFSRLLLTNCSWSLWTLPFGPPRTSCSCALQRRAHSIRIVSIGPESPAHIHARSAAHRQLSIFAQNGQLLSVRCAARRRLYRFLLYLLSTSIAPPQLTNPMRTLILPRCGGVSWFSWSPIYGRIRCARLRCLGN